MDKKQLIMDIAEEMFADLGFDATSIRELAKRAKVNIAMISYYFGSKEKLFEELIISKATIMFAKLQTITKNETIEPFEKLETLVDLYIERFYTNENYYKILQRELHLTQRSRLHDSIIEIMEKNSQEIKGLIRDAVEKGLFREVDADLLLATIFGTILNAVRKYSLKNSDGSDDNEYKQELFKDRLRKHLNEMLRAYLEVR